MRFCEEAQKRSNTYTNMYTRSYGNYKWLYYLCIICPWKDTLRNNEKFNGKKEPLRDELDSMINRGATTTTDTICADNLNVDAWWIAKKQIHHNNVGTIWRRLIAWIEMHTETPT